jgi:DUF4097 and DUF4098 domain-containing protein YvlB
MKTPNPTEFISSNLFTQFRMRLLAVVALGGMALSLHAATESNLHKAFNVQRGRNLIVDADLGSIEIVPGDGAEAVIEVHRSVSGVSDAKAAEILANHEVTFDQDGDRVSVHAKSKKRPGGWLNSGSVNFQVNFRIAVPRKFNLDLQTAAGSIKSGDIEGKVKVHTSGGSLEFGSIKGPFDGHTSAGSIKLAGATGPVAAKTSGGSIHLGVVEDVTTAETSAGSITVDTANAKLTAKTSGGALVLGQLAGPADVRTSAGSIKVKSSKARLDAQTSGGSIEIEDAADTVVAHTSAGGVRATITAQPKEDSRLSTSGGGITIRLAENLGFDVDASSNAGGVNSDFQIGDTAPDGKNHGTLQGKLNGGGKALVLKTTAGGIQIKRK